MTVKIEIEGENVKAAHEQMLAMLFGSEALKRRIDEEFASGRMAEQWKDEEGKWAIEEVQDLADFVQRLARLISSGKAKEFFPEWNRDFARCEKLSSILDQLIAIKKAA